MELKKLIEETFEINVSKLLGWANRKVSNRDEAEELCQEVAVRFCTLVYEKHSGGEDIEDINKFFWITANNTLHEHFRFTKQEERMNDGLKEEAITLSELDPDDSNNCSEQLKYMRKCISQLNYIHREAMIMYYVEKKSLDEIGLALDTTKNYIKKLITESRHKIKTDYETGRYDLNKEYRPDRLKMSFSGEAIDYSDLLDIGSNLSRQNICLCCYEKPQSLDDIGLKLGLPKAYLEFDMEWLLRKGFIKKQKNMYSTTFFIYDKTFNTMLINTFIKHKPCLDLIVKKLIEKQDRIKAIKFVGCEKPIEKLLWFLIYSFTDTASSLACFDENGYNYENLYRTDGGKYYPIGVFDSKSKIPIDPLYVEQYKDLDSWTCDGTHIYEDGQNELSWIGLYNYPTLQDEMADKVSPKPFILKNKEILFKIIKPDFSINDLSGNEKDILSQLIALDFLSISETDEKILPNFLIFTTKQRNELTDIFLDIYIDIKTNFTNLKNDLQKECKAILPDQLSSSLGYYIYFGMMFSHIFTTGFAYYDGKLYQPKNENETLVLTVNITTNDEQKNVKPKYTVRLRIDNV
ncbi:MAG: sigma-70 family RNA polymerase sigma factor [Candidatus Cloacimonetes bacterium]|nr:sigma-70 family RNA polymerase sigma factor [Candidatus Cloacimonadota bacterium]